MTTINTALPDPTQRAVNAVQTAQARKAAPTVVDDMTPEERTRIKGFAAPWKLGLDLSKGQLVYFENVTYKVRQAHTVKDPDAAPPATPALYRS